MRIIPNQSEKHFVSHLMKTGQKSIRMNPNESETKFSIQFNPNQSALGLIQTEFSFRINPNESKVEMIRIDSD